MARIDTPVEAQHELKAGSLTMVDAIAMAVAYGKSIPGASSAATLGTSFPPALRALRSHIVEGVIARGMICHGPARAVH